MSKFVIAYVLTYMGCLAASFLIDVSWGVYFYQLNYFLNPTHRWWASGLPDLRFSFIIAVCILISYAIQNQRYKANRIFDTPQTKWLLANYILFALISFWAVWPEMHSKTLLNHTKLLVFLFIAYKVIDTPKKFDGMIWSFLLGSFYVGWVARSSPRDSMGRMEKLGPSDAPDANVFSAIPILLYYFVRLKSWQRVLPALFLAYIANALILMNSRGGVLGLIVGCAYMGVHIFFDKEVPAKNKAQLLVLTLFGFCAFVYLADPVFWERMGTIEVEYHSDLGGGGRKFFWWKTFDLVKQHPLGVGTWGYQYLSPQFIPEKLLSQQGGLRAVHSLYFQSLAERGYVGFVVFMVLLLSSFRFLRNTRHNLRNKGELLLNYLGLSLESGFIAFLTASIFLSQLHAEILYWYMLFIACFCNIYGVKDFDSERAAKSNSA